MSEKKSPLARLVLFMVCLSVAGAFVSGVYTFAVEQPQRQSVTAPTNLDVIIYQECVTKCIDPVKNVADRQCLRACDRYYLP